MKDYERDLLYKVEEAAFANPFGERRSAIDMSVTGLSAETSTDKILQQLVAKVGKTTNEVQSRMANSSKQLNEKDQQLLRTEQQ